MCSTSARIAGQCYLGGYNQAFGRSAITFATNDYSFFVQDDYRLSSRLTLNLGLRYEYQQLPQATARQPAVQPSWYDIRAGADAELSLRQERCRAAARFRLQRERHWQDDDSRRVWHLSWSHPERHNRVRHQQHRHR